MLSQGSHDAGRVQRVLQKLSHYGLRDFHLTGRLALETHAHGRKVSLTPRALNDIDLVVNDFTALPDGLAEGFLVRHVHPDSVAGRIVVQLVDPYEALRIDIFSAFGNSRARSSREMPYFGEMPVVSVEDLTSRCAALLMNLERGNQVPRKHFEDFLVLASWADPERVEIAWLDHRKKEDPRSFKDVCDRVGELVRSHEELLVSPKYSQDVDAVCLKCREVGAWRLADGKKILSILGYL